VYRWELLNPDAEIDYLPHPRPVDGAAMKIRKLATTINKQMDWSLHSDDVIKRFHKGGCSTTGVWCIYFCNDDFSVARDHLIYGEMGHSCDRDCYYVLHFWWLQFHHTMFSLRQSWIHAYFRDLFLVGLYKANKKKSTYPHTSTACNNKLHVFDVICHTGRAHKQRASLHTCTR
jgi:hypothetical protein